MAPYTVNFLGSDKQVIAEDVQWFEHDDHALDTIGRGNHPHEISVRQGQQLVALFPPLRKRPHYSPMALHGTDAKAESGSKLLILEQDSDFRWFHLKSSCSRRGRWRWRR